MNHDDPDDEDAPPAEAVTERAAQQDERREREQVAVGDPLQLGQARAELLADPDERDVDDGAVEQGHARAEHGGGDDEPTGAGAEGDVAHSAQSATAKQQLATADCASIRLSAGSRRREVARPLGVARREAEEGVDGEDDEREPDDAEADPPLGGHVLAEQEHRAEQLHDRGDELDEPDRDERDAPRRGGEAAAAAPRSTTPDRTSSDVCTRAVPPEGEAALARRRRGAATTATGASTTVSTVRPWIASRLTPDLLLRQAVERERHGQRQRHPRHATARDRRGRCRRRRRSPTATHWSTRRRSPSTTTPRATVTRGLRK